MLILCGLLLTISIIDARCGIIPNWANAAIALTGLGRAAWGMGPSLVEAALAAVIMFTLVLLLHAGFIHWRGRSGIGMGDVKFLAAAAIWTGAMGLPTLILVASISGLLFIIIRSFAGITIDNHTRLAFGPHLAAGLAFVVLFGSLN
jgi:leader peptidase (prepilin peptidase)/N-methyltransferase